MYLQRTTTEKSKIEGLRSSIVALENLFDSPPGTVEELRNRNGLLRYVLAVSSLLSVDLLSASSRVSEKNSNRYLRHRIHSSLLILLKATESFPGTLKVYERLYLITGFVYGSVSLTDVDKDNS